MTNASPAPVHPQATTGARPQPQRGAVRRRLGGGLALVGALLLAACAAPLDARKDAPYYSYATQADRPVVRPTRSLSSFSDSLMCMDHLLRDAQLPPTLITSKQLPDYSSRVPVATKDMIVTALSQMSRLSNAFRFVDYEVDIARQDTVQNLTTILLNNNQMQLQRPALYFSGAVAYVDQNVIANRFDVGTSASRLDTGYSRSRTATLIALELHLGDFRTRTLIPGLDSANEVVVGGAGQGLDLAGRIGDYGVKFNVGRDYTQGAGAAMRTLIDLATIELVGKWARVPYWQCLTLDQTHPTFQRQMREWYDEAGPQAASRLIQTSLVARGYLPLGGPTLEPDRPELRDALSRFQVDNRLIASGVVDFATYERALRNYVALSADGTLSRIGWDGSGAIQVANAATPVAAPLAAPPQANAVRLQIENPLPAGDRTAFEEGEQVFLAVHVARTAHLYCYFVDARGSLMRLLPNAVNPGALTPANVSVRIPDWMAPNPGFIMDAGTPGTEQVGCFASDADPQPGLPAPLRGPALQAVAGYHSLDAIGDAFTQAVGSNGFARGQIEWKVAPRRTVPPAAAPATAPAAGAAAPAR